MVVRSLINADSMGAQCTHLLNCRNINTVYSISDQPRIEAACIHILTRSSIFFLAGTNLVFKLVHIYPTRCSEKVGLYGAIYRSLTVLLWLVNCEGKFDFTGAGYLV